MSAALAIADRDGLETLTMRSLAKELECNPMSLYAHVDSKDALLDLMADRSMASLPALRPDGEWREEITRFFVAFHDLFVRHPAVAHVMVQRPLAGEISIRRGERALDRLLAAGFDDSDALELFIALSSYTIGASLYELARRAPTQPLAAHRFDELQEGDHPTLYRLRDKLTGAASDDQFRRGLTRLVASYARERDE